MTNSNHAGSITTSANGKDAIFQITANGNGVATVTILDGGIDFADSETITINDGLLGSNNNGTLAFNVSDVITFGDTFIEMLDGGTGHDVNDTITITDAQLGNGGGNSLVFDVAEKGNTVKLGTSVTLDSASPSSITFEGQGATFE